MKHLYIIILVAVSCCPYLLSGKNKTKPQLIKPMSDSAAPLYSVPKDPSRNQGGSPSNKPVRTVSEAAPQTNHDLTDGIDIFVKQTSTGTIKSRYWKAQLDIAWQIPDEEKRKARILEISKIITTTGKNL